MLSASRTCSPARLASAIAGSCALSKMYFQCSIVEVKPTHCSWPNLAPIFQAQPKRHAGAHSAPCNRHSMLLAAVDEFLHLLDAEIRQPELDRCAHLSKPLSQERYKKRMRLRFQISRGVAGALDSSLWRNGRVMAGCFRSSDSSISQWRLNASIFDSIVRNCGLATAVFWWVVHVRAPKAMIRLRWGAL